MCVRCLNGYGRLAMLVDWHMAYCRCGRSSNMILIHSLVRVRSGSRSVLKLEVVLGHGDGGRPGRRDHLLLELLIYLKIRQALT